MTDDLKNLASGISRLSMTEITRCVESGRNRARHRYPFRYCREAPEDGSTTMLGTRILPP
jgi:hypothetical protein